MSEIVGLSEQVATLVSEVRKFQGQLESLAERQGQTERTLRMLAGAEGSETLRDSAEGTADHPAPRILVWDTRPVEAWSKSAGLLSVEPQGGERSAEERHSIATSVVSIDVPEGKRRSIESDNLMRRDSTTISEKSEKEVDREDSGASSTLGLWDVWRRPSKSEPSDLVREISTRRGHMSLAEDLAQELFDAEVAQLAQEDAQKQIFRYRCSRLLKRLMTKPTSNVSMAWDLVFILMIVYEVCTIPLLLLDPPKTIFSTVMDWTSRIFWTMNIFRCFLTGYVNSSGTIEMSPHLVAKQYIMSWFPFDLAIVLGDWTEAAFDSTKLLQSLRLLRVTRTLRVLRLMAPGKNFTDVSSLIRTVVNTDDVGLVISLMKITGAIFGFAHFIACFWYGLGKMAADNGNPNWVETYEVSDRPFSERYLRSLQWAVVKYVGGSDLYVPQNQGERLFTVCALVCAFVAGAGFVSSLTNAMTRSTIMSSQQDQQYSRLQKYLRQRSISTKLKLRVTHSAKYVLQREQLHSKEESIELLQQISQPLRIELHYEVYSPILRLHPFFREYDSVNHTAMTNVCHSAVKEKMVYKGDVIFTEGEASDDVSMLVIMDGLLIYACIQRMSTCRVLPDQVICELVLWVSGWIYRGTMRAADHTALLVLSAEAFHRVAKEFQASAFYPAKYARAVHHQLAQFCNDDLSDVESGLDVEELCAEVFGPGNYVSKEHRMSFSSKLSTNSNRLSRISAA